MLLTQQQQQNKKFPKLKKKELNPLRHIQEKVYTVQSKRERESIDRQTVRLKESIQV